MTNSIKNIVIVSSGQPSLNPRLVKEADALTLAGYNVTVLYAYWNDWGTRYDEELIPGKTWKAQLVGGDPKKRRSVYFLSRLIQKIARFGLMKIKISYFAEAALSRSTLLLWRKTRRTKADLYIAHNLGALPAVVAAAKTHKKPCGFDAEDFHRFEISDDILDKNVALNIFIEDKYLPQITYLSASSPMIADAYQKLYPQLRPITLLNVFPADLTITSPVLSSQQHLKLFWFSQTIGPNRGIEIIIQAIKLLPANYFELHLLGFITEETKRDFIDRLQPGKIGVYFHAPVSPDALIAFAAGFDIGFASELIIPYNRDICLTNKIFTYMQSGLAIIASNTASQSRLLAEYPFIGRVYQQDNVQMLADILAYYWNNRGKLLESRSASFAVGRDNLNWEHEAPKLLNLIKDLSFAVTHNEN